MTTTQRNLATSRPPGAGVRGDLDEELVRRATELQPLLAENAARTEADRCVAEDNIEAMREAGLFKLMVPKRLGGFETTIETKIEVSAALAEGCGSTAWINALTNVCAWLTSLLPEQGQLDVFGADPDARVAGVIAPSTDIEKVDGGYVVSGRWAWSSGCLHATWAIAGVLQRGPDGAPLDLGNVFMPMNQLAIEDTWYVAGMKGTGSNTIIAHKVFVPEHRYLSSTQALQGITPTPFKDEALYRAAFAPVLVLILVGPLLGLGRAALKIALDKAPRRAVSYTRIARQTDSTAFQMKLSEAAMMLDTATLHAHRAAADIDGFASSGEQMDYLTKARVKADTGWVSRNVRRAIDTVLDAHGASGFADSSPMQRIWRDANTAGRHAVVNPLVTEEVFGKALLGIGPEGQITDLI